MCVHVCVHVRACVRVCMCVFTRACSGLDGQSVQLDSSKAGAVLCAARQARGCRQANRIMATVTVDRGSDYSVCLTCTRAGYVWCGSQTHLPSSDPDGSAPRVLARVLISVCVLVQCHTAATRTSALRCWATTASKSLSCPSTVPNVRCPLALACTRAQTLGIGSTAHKQSNYRGQIVLSTRAVHVQ